MAGDHSRRRPLHVVVVAHVPCQAPGQALPAGLLHAFRNPEGVLVERLEEVHPHAHPVEILGVLLAREENGRVNPPRDRVVHQQVGAEGHLRGGVDLERSRHPRLEAERSSVDGHGVRGAPGLQLDVGVGEVEVGARALGEEVVRDRRVGIGVLSEERVAAGPLRIPVGQAARVGLDPRPEGVGRPPGHRVLDRDQRGDLSDVGVVQVAAQRSGLVRGPQLVALVVDLGRHEDAPRLRAVAVGRGEDDGLGDGGLRRLLLLLLHGIAVTEAHG